MRLDRKIQPRHLAGDGSVAGGGQRQLVAADEALARLDAGDLAKLIAADAGHFTMLDPIDTALVRPAPIPPGNGIMARRAAALLQETTENREASMVEVEIGHHLAHLLAVEQFGGNPVHHHRIAAPRIGVALPVRVEEIDDATL